MKNWRSQFKEWLKEILPWDSKIEKYIQFEGHYPEDWNLDENLVSVHTKRQYDKSRIGVLVYTKDHSYQIGARETYLGCIMSNRKSRAGEWWTRGRDLPDGKFCQKTWDSIKRAIIGTELIKVMRPQIITALPDE